VAARLITADTSVVVPALTYDVLGVAVELVG
jgi:hypothetical protein